MKILTLDSVDSTNSYLERNAGEFAGTTLVAATEQTAGRGQRGNSWESEPGKNLTFSVLYRPNGFAAARQFHMSEATALATVDFLAAHGIEANVKWPNDIYVGDKKICGILIKHSLCGPDIEHSIIGAGVNVNQKGFLSDAPNPVSMTNLTGKEYDLSQLLREMAAHLERRLESISTDAGKEVAHQEFKSRLWRGDGCFHPFTDTATGERFDARISDIHPQGFMELTDTAGMTRRYAFKEVSFLL